MEVIHDGWLKKSPPEKRIWRAKWRRRWFVLRQSGQIPGQYVLEYYTDTTCKKLKGRIDLDQCEQVDAGVSLDTVTRKYTYEYVFDIRTPKRIYYLVADQDNDMNTWVNFISTVCGLKMQVDDEYAANSAAPVDRPPAVVANQPVNEDTTAALSRTDSPSLTSLSTIGPSGPYIPISECTSGPCPVPGAATLARRSPPPPAVAPRPPATITTSLPSALPPLTMPHDRRFRGRDVVVNGMGNDDDDDDEGFPNQVPPPPPKSGVGSGGGRLHSAEFYDYPRQINPLGLDDEPWSASPDPGRRYDPRAHQPPSYATSGGRSARSVQDWASRVPPPPKVNWETYPRGGLTSCDTGGAIYENQEQLAQSEDCYDHPQYHHPQPNTVAVEPSTGNKLERLSLSDSGVEMQRSASSSPQDANNSTVAETGSSRHAKTENGGATTSSPSTVATLKPPPRPPKPSHLSESYSPRGGAGNSGNGATATTALSSANYDNVENCEVFAAAAAADDSLYDVPPSAQGVFLSKNLPAQVFAYLRDDSIESVMDAVPPPCALSYVVQQEDTYDLPRPLDADRRHQLDATPPAPKGESLWQRRHAYVNACLAVVVMEEPGKALPHDDDSSSNNYDEYLSMDTQRQRRAGQQEVYTDMSGEGRSPSAIYSNVPSPMSAQAHQRLDNVFVLDGEEAAAMSAGVQPPPCVDRGLKPRRRTATGSSPVAPGMSSPFVGSGGGAVGLGGGSPVSQRQWKSERKLSDTSVQSLPANLPGPQPPPTINRCLKPKRAVEAPDVFSGAPATPITIATLSLPTKHKRSFRKPRAIPGLNAPTASPSRLTSTNGLLHPPNHRLHEKSSSDDDHSSSCSSRRNSSNDDHQALKQQSQQPPPQHQHTKSPSPSAFGFGRHHHHHNAHHHSKSEVQYLDLDLESDASAQSPKSPERLASGAGGGGGAAGTGHHHHSTTNSNTVYKTVDFVKTKAFNEMRQNVEETYRKSQ